MKFYMKKSIPSERTKKDQKGETYENVNALFRGRNMILNAFISKIKILIKT